MGDLEFKVIEVKCPRCNSTDYLQTGLKVNHVQAIINCKCRQCNTYFDAYYYPAVIQMAMNLEVNSK